MKKVKSWIFRFTIAIFLSILTGCTTDTTPLNQRKIDFASERIFLSLGEGYLSPDSIMAPRILLKMRTEKIYPCLNYRIENRVTQQGSQITLMIQGIRLSGEVCLTALGPARASRFFDLAEGEYQLKIVWGRSTDSYLLNVTADKLELRPRQTSFTSPEFTCFWRYPENSFVYLCGTMPQNGWIYQDFLDTLQRHLDLQEFEFPAGCQTCYPAASSGHYVDWPARYFYYQSEADFRQAGELLRTYVRERIADEPGVGISLINWKNQSYHSWLMDQ